MSMDEAIICLKFWVWLKAEEATDRPSITDNEALIAPLTHFFAPRRRDAPASNPFLWFCSRLEDAVLAVGGSEGGARWILHEPFWWAGISS